MFYGGPVNIKRLFLKGNLLHSLRSVVFYRRTKRRSRAKIGIDCLFFFLFWSVSFFFVVVVVILEWVLCGGGWRVLCTCVSFFFEKV